MVQYISNWKLHGLKITNAIEAATSLLIFCSLGMLLVRIFGGKTAFFGVFLKTNDVPEFCHLPKAARNRPTDQWHAFY